MNIEIRERIRQAYIDGFNMGLSYSDISSLYIPDVDTVADKYMEQTEN